ncbi:unnamed protein product [Staurois parvus]|uniref:Uncharacterized protein n=1 Tax=Staurois parvus TaxID=386267 RepID=A0ABN9F0W0_9NEOB|nr:unnamed protein product [Staurois parvus]
MWCGKPACFLHHVQKAMQLRSAEGVNVELMTFQMQCVCPLRIHNFWCGEVRFKPILPPCAAEHNFQPLSGAD